MGIGSYDDDRDWWWHFSFKDTDKAKVKVTCARLNEFENLDEYNVKPGSLSTIINSLIKVYNNVPEEYRDQAYLSVYSYDYSESVYADVFYVRDMTPEEDTEETAKKLEDKRKYEEDERRHFEMLKLKFEESEK